MYGGKRCKCKHCKQYETVCMIMCLLCSLFSSNIGFPSLPLDISNSCFCFNTWYFFYWKLSSLALHIAVPCSFLNSIFLGGCLLPGYSDYSVYFFNNSSCNLFFLIVVKYCYLLFLFLFTRTHWKMGGVLFTCLVDYCVVNDVENGC